jgi:hypothetical protein
MSSVRQFAEVQTGDCVLDVVIPLVIVATIGSTSLTVGQILDLPAFNAANIGAATPATFTNYAHLYDLPFAQVVMYGNAADWTADTNGQVWVQAKISDQLVRSWESVFAGMVLGEAMLLRKAT